VRWLGFIAIAVTVLLSASCGCGSSFITQRDNGSFTAGPATEKGHWAQRLTTQEYGQLASRAAMPPRMAELLLKPELPSAGMLPALPELGLPGKLPAAVETRERQGSDEFLGSTNSVDSGSKRVLSALPWDISWAIYQLADISIYDQLQTLSVDVTKVDQADQLEYWVGLANYKRGSWEVLAKSQAEAFSRALAQSASYRSPVSSSVYVFVLVFDNHRLNVDRVALELDAPRWIEAQVDDGPHAGYAPAIAFAQTGNPVIVYADYDTGLPMIAIGDRTLDLRQQANWSIAPINPAPKGVGAWLDVLIDPTTGLPTVSIDYVAITGEALDSQAGFSPMVLVDSNPVFLNYELGMADGAFWTSIDRRQDGMFGVATTADNINTPSRPRNDMQYRLIEFDPANWGSSVNVTLTSNFGENWLFPHLRFHPMLGDGSVCVGGGLVEYESSANVWEAILDETSTTSLGSLAYNPVGNLLGSTFQSSNGSVRELKYASFDDLLNGTQQVVESRTDAATGDYVGAASQLAYTPDGFPAIAYAVADSGSIAIKYAQHDGNSWTIEQVSVDVSLPTDPSSLVLLDLAFDENGVPGISYNRLQGDSTTLRFVMRGS